MILWGEVYSKNLNLTSVPPIRLRKGVPLMKMKGKLKINVSKELRAFYSMNITRIELLFHADRGQSVS